MSISVDILVKLIRFMEHVECTSKNTDKVLTLWQLKMSRPPELILLLILIVVPT